MGKVRYYVARDGRWRRCKKRAAQAELRRGCWVRAESKKAIAYAGKLEENTLQWSLICARCRKCEAVWRRGRIGMEIGGVGAVSWPCATWGECRPDAALPFMRRLVTDVGCIRVSHLR